MDVAANALGFLGVVLLAFPAFYAARYGVLVAKLAKIAPFDPLLRDKHKEAIEGLRNAQSEWGPGLSWCLRIGTVLAGGSYFLQLVKPIFS
ncbi:MAG: hypothetical protein KIT25_11935 [Enhydrobacter sp.]|nr:MAG: hypothetical protein KIT25_11935 [Enhydrobacter sp.]